MADELIHIPNDDTQNYPLFRLQLVIEMFIHSTVVTNPIKVPKVDQTIE